jgi:hypothetical protein
MNAGDDYNNVSPDTIPSCSSLAIILFENFIAFSNNSVKNLFQNKKVSQLA